MHAYLHIPTSVQGPGLKLVGTQAGPCASAAPLALHDGTLTWHLPSGGLHAHTLATHTHLADAAPATSRSASRSCSGKWRAQAQADAAAAAGLTKEERLAARCRQALALCRFDAAVGAARQLGDAALLREAAAAALQFLELPAAAAAYEAAGDEEALAQLRPLLGEADAALVAGQVIAMTGGELCC